MFIDHNNYSSSNFISLLQLQNVTISQIDTIDLLTSVHSGMNVLWESVNLSFYTDHSLKHSFRIIKYFMLFDPFYQWSPYERLVFGLAAIIHDIGMQYKYWANDILVEKGFPDPSTITDEEIRKSHPELCDKLIALQNDKDPRLIFPYRLCKFGHFYLNPLVHAKKVACCHSGNKYLQEIYTDDVDWKNRSLYDGNKYRPRLLAIILRLCDELDGDINRIITPERISNWDINPVSKMHWLSCMFIESTDVILDQYNTFHFVLNWQVPSDSTLTERELSKKFIDNIRKFKIQQEILLGKECAQKFGEFLQFPFQIDPIPENPITAVFSVNEDIYQYMNLTASKKPILDLYISKNQEIQNASTEESESIELPDTNSSLEDKLHKWFERNKKQEGHYVLLSNGEHTDTYLKCRTLVSNQRLLSQITFHIMETLQRNNINGINCVLAVGTSAIPLAINVSLRLNCSFTFTFSRKKINPSEKISKVVGGIDGKKQDYNLVETIPIVANKSKLLIIDDVISGGSVAQEVLDLLSSMKKMPKAVYHYSIFRLGDREITRHKKIGGNYFWAIHIPDVYYAYPGECILCKNNIKIIKEEEMF
jgi:orotate phosphoribosyltransferase